MLELLIAVLLSLAPLNPRHVELALCQARLEDLWEKHPALQAYRKERGLR